MRRILAFITVATACAFAQTTPAMPKHHLTSVTPSQSLQAVAASFGVVKFDHGRYLAFDNQNGPKIAVLNDTGTADASPLLIPGAAKNAIYDAVLQPNGNIVASGWATKTDGAMLTFIAEISRDGKLESVVRTTPFAPYRLCSAANGQVWAFGRDIDAETHDNVPSYPMMRLFGVHGGVLKTAMEHSIVGDKHVNPYTVSLACNQNAGVVYFPTTGHIIELSFADGSVRKWSTQPASSLEYRTTGLSLTKSGDLFATIQMLDSTPRITSLFHVSLPADRSVANWDPIVDESGTAVRENWIRLLGTSGDELIVRRGQSGDTFRVTVNEDR
jgi:hypothetical protein